MLNVLSAIKKAQIGNVPRMGLRLVNKLQKDHISDKFWLDYIDFVRNPENFRKLNPHSKCLLTCVFTKLDKNLIKKSCPDDLIKTIYFDTININCIDFLTLESINMILVSSYTLGIPLTYQQLDLLLSRIYGDINNLGMLNEFNQDSKTELIRTRTSIEDFVSILHSLASIGKQFPKHMKRISESEVIRNYVDNIDSILSLVNSREFSLIIFSFDKLKLLDSHFSNKFYNYAKNILHELDYQSMSTIFYICSNNSRLQNLFKLVKNRIDSIIDTSTIPTTTSTSNDTISIIDGNLNSMYDSHSSHNSNPKDESNNMEELSGRDTCSIMCSLVRKNCFDDRHYRYLVRKLNEMKIMELCNITSLLIKSKYPIGNDFKNAIVDKILNSNLENVVILDALTVVHCFYQWSKQNEMILERLVFSISTNGNFVFNEKSILFLHYLVQLNFRNINSLLKLYEEQFSINSSHLRPSQLLIFYNSLISLKGDECSSNNNTKVSNNNITTNIDNNSNNNNNDIDTDIVNVSENIDIDLLKRFIDKIEPKLLEFNFKELSRMDLFTLAKSSNQQIVDRLFDYMDYDPSKYLGILLNIIKHNNKNNLNIINRSNHLLGKLNLRSYFDIDDFNLYKSNKDINDNTKDNNPNDQKNLVIESKDLFNNIYNIEKILRLSELLNVLVELNNIDMLNKIVQLNNSSRNNNTKVNNNNITSNIDNNINSSKDRNYNTKGNNNITNSIINGGNNNNNQFVIMLNVLNSCKKLRLLNPDVELLMVNMVDNFEIYQTNIGLKLYVNKNKNQTNLLEKDTGKIVEKNKKNILEKHLEKISGKTLVQDLVGVLYHLDYFNRSEYMDYNLTRLLDLLKLDRIYTFNSNNNIITSNIDNNSNISSNANFSEIINTNKNSNINNNINNSDNTNDNNTSKHRIDNSNNNNKCTIDERELFESFLFSSSSLCFNAVINNKIIIKIIKYYLNNCNNHSAIVLKCLAMNKINLEDFSLEELKKIKKLEFQGIKYISTIRIEDNAIHSSLFSTLSKLNYSIVPEYQIMDYRVDLYIK